MHGKVPRRELLILVALNVVVILYMSAPIVIPAISSALTPAGPCSPLQSIPFLCVDTSGNQRINMDPNRPQGGTLIQTNSNSCAVTCPSTLTVAFSSNVADGDTVSAVVTYDCPGCTVTFSDTRGSTYSPDAGPTGTTATHSFTSKLSSSGADTVMATFSGGTPKSAHFSLAELSGITPLPLPIRDSNHQTDGPDILETLAALSLLGALDAAAVKVQVIIPFIRERIASWNA